MSDVAGAVARALCDIGYETVVVGGSASTMHAPEAYRSLDIDMVVIGGIDRARDVTAAMNRIGFALASHMFVHAENPYIVEFVPGPVAIGNDFIREFAVIETEHGGVRVLTASDAVCDRLNKYIAYSDRDSLTVAVDVARACDVDIAAVEAFMARQAIASPSFDFDGGLRRFRAMLQPRSRSSGRFAFSTIVEIDFAEDVTKDAAAQSVAILRKFLDDTREEIADLVAVGQSGTLKIDGDRCAASLELRHDRELPFVERLHMAADVIRHLRSHASTLVAAEIVDDDAPPIASR